MNACHWLAVLFAVGLSACGTPANEPHRDGNALARHDGDEPHGDKVGRAEGERHDGPKVDVDNTGRNDRDANGSTATPLDQSESAADIEISATIRRAVMGDSNLSMNAKNCKIITANGVTILRGVVASDAERTAIEAKATATAGVLQVVNELEVKAQ